MRSANKLLCFYLIFTLLIMFPTCRREAGKASEDSAEIIQLQTADKQELVTSPGRRRGQGPPAQSGNRGYGRRRLGKQAEGPWGAEDVVELTEGEKEAVHIETIKAAFRPMRSQLHALGKVMAHPQRKAIVSYAFPARVARVHIQIGDWVKAGQQLVTLQSEEVGAAKSEFYKAMADHELAQVNFERQKRLFDRGVGAKKNYLSSEAELKVAEASLNAAEKKLHVLGFTENQVKDIAESHQINPVITLYAPLGGKIIEHKAVLGAMVDQTIEIMTIMDPKVLVIDADIYEKDIAKIKIGQEVEASVLAYPGEKFKGKISFISDILNQETRTITVRTEVDNHGYKLKPGMFADIDIFLNHQSKALAIPNEAILDERGEQIVFLKIEEKYIPVTVETGAREGDYVEVVRGLVEGDEVVTKGNFQLKSKLYEEILKKGHVH